MPPAATPGHAAREGNAMGRPRDANESPPPVRGAGEAALPGLRRAIAAGAPPHGAAGSLFQVGRRLGEAEAVALLGAGHEGPEALARGLERLAALGLGRAVLDSCELDRARGQCRVRGHVLAGADAPAGAAAEVTVGYLTGLTAAVGGLDVACGPFRCAAPCARCGCAFELAPAPHGAAAPAGSAPARDWLADAGVDPLDVLESTADAILVLDAAGVIRFWNRGAERMFGWGREEVVGRDAGFLMPPDLVAAGEPAQLQARLAQDAAVRNHVTRRMGKNGRELWAGVGLALLHDGQGNVVGSTAVIRDVSDQRATDAQLCRARGAELLGQMAAKFAHELKNPLAGIHAAVQLLKREAGPDDPDRAVFDSVGAEIRRLDDTVQDLLRLARPEPARLRAGSLEACMREWLGALRLHPDVARHRVETAIGDGLHAEFDGRLLGRALTNLVLNAGQAMAQPGVIRVSAQRTAAGITLEVADEGPGIPAGMHDRIFEPFFTTKTRGTGLGLAIARQNVEANGGTLEAGDRAGGAVFRILLPAPAAAQRGA
jgi:two-component system sensor histidine kinase AtoS